MDEISETIRKNKEISDKFSGIEESLAACAHPKDLFETAVTQIQHAFDIPFVWVSLIDRPELAGLARTLQSSNRIGDRIALIGEATFSRLLTDGTKPVLANRELRPFYRLFPKNKKYFIKSVAVAPVTLHGKIIGSINHGDAADGRFEPDLDTTLLRQLAESLSVRLSGLLLPDPAEADR